MRCAAWSTPGSTDRYVEYGALVVAAGAAAAAAVAAAEVATQPRAVGRGEQRLGACAVRIVDGDEAAQPAAAEAAAHEAGGPPGLGLDPGAVVRAVLDGDRDLALARARVLGDAGVRLAAVARHHGEVVGRGAAREGEAGDEEKGSHGVSFRRYSAIISTNSWTGVASSCFGLRQTSRISSLCFSAKRRARLVLNFSTRNGIPSLRPRLWPMGNSTTNSFIFLPSLNSTSSALPIHRFSRPSYSS